MDKENQEEPDIVVLSETEDDNDAMNCSMDVEEVLVNAENFRLIDQDGREISLEDHVNYCRNDSADENVQEEEQNTSADQVSYTLNERDGLVIQVKEGNSSKDHVDYCMNKNVGVVVKVPKGNTLNKTPVKRKLATEPKIVRIEDILTSKVNSVGKLELRRVGNPFKINVSNLKTTENTPKINVPEGSLLTKENPPRVNLPEGSQTKENQPKNMSAERRNLALKRMKRKQLCRLCLAKNCDLLPLFETSLRFSVTPLQEVIESCFGMQVSAEDVYDQICPSCVTSLENFWNFRDKCQQSNTVIEQMNMRWEQQAAMKARSQNPKPTPVKNVEVSCTICGEKVRNEFLKDHYERHKSTGEGKDDEVIGMDEEFIRNLVSTKVDKSPDDSLLDANPGQEQDIPSEKIPGRQKNSSIYADGRGFYFYVEKTHKEKT